MPRRRSSKNQYGTVIILALLALVLYVVFSGALSAGSISLPVQLTLPAVTFQAPAVTLELPGQTPGQTTPQAQPSQQAGPDGWYQLYFTDPNNPTASQRAGGPDGPLVAAIDAAQATVDMAIYNLSLPSVGDALLRAQQRGVRVRLVMESDNMDGSVVRSLQTHKVPLIGDRGEGLMHNKFVVIDTQQVWTGSMNLTPNGAYDDNNNFMQIRNAKIAADYAREFDEMFTGDHFGADAVADTPYPKVLVDGPTGGTLVEVYFSPDDRPAERVVKLLNGAQESIFFLTYSFTSDSIAGALEARAKAGVTVAGMFEKDMVASNTGTEYPALKAKGLDVRLDGNRGLMHHKLFIIDQSIVVMGSYNFTAAAENRNDENMLIIYNPDIAARFMDEFARVQQQAAP